MIQWTIKKTIKLMGNIYVFLDKFIDHKTSPILEVEIDQDFQDMSRRELCNHIIWHLDSTQKIRLCCQMARDMAKGEEE
jgi:hypothetical protein